MSFTIEGMRIRNSVRKMIRGLYFHIAQEMLVGGIHVVSNSDNLRREIDDEFEQTVVAPLRNEKQHRIGQKTFAYRYFISESSGVSVWELTFFDALVFYCTVLPLESARKLGVPTYGK